MQKYEKIFKSILIFRGSNHSDTFITDSAIVCHDVEITD